MKKIEIIEIKKENLKEQEVLKNLVKMYCAEWSMYNGLDVDENGIYPFEKYVPSFYFNIDKHAFLIMYDNKWAGFALIDKDFNIHLDYDYAMSEFYIIPKYRSIGLGSFLAKYLFNKYQGKWEIGRNPKNKSSVLFWDKVLGEYTNNNYETIYASSKHQYADGTLGDVLSFIYKEKNNKKINYR